MRINRFVAKYDVQDFYDMRTFTSDMVGFAQIRIRKQNFNPAEPPLFKRDFTAEELASLTEQEVEAIVDRKLVELMLGGE